MTGLEKLHFEVFDKGQDLVVYRREMPNSLNIQWLRFTKPYEGPWTCIALFKKFVVNAEGIGENGPGERSGHWESYQMRLTRGVARAIAEELDRLERARKRGKAMIATDDELVEFVREYISRYGYSPTVRELCARFGYKAPSAIKERLDKLKKKGRVTFNEKTPRTLRVVEDGDRR